MNHEFNVIPVNRVAEGLFRQVMSQIPQGCPEMEAGDFIGVAPVELLLEEVGKETVITEPFSRLVQWHEKQSLSFQDFQHLLSIFPLSDGIAQGTAQAIQDAGLEQELPQTVRQGCKHIFAQVIGDEAMPATDDQLIRPRETLLEGKRHQL